MQTQKRTHIPSIIVILVAGIGLLTTLLTLGGALLAGALALVQSGDFSQVQMFHNGFWISLLMSVLLGLVLASAILRVSGKSLRLLPSVPRFNLAWVLLALWLPLLVAGHFVSRNADLAWIILPPLQVAIVAIPLFWVLEFARRKLNTNTPDREWGLFGIGISFTPTFVIILEFIVLGLIFLLAVIYLAARPDLANELQRLSMRVINSGGDPDVVLRALRPILQNPLVIFGALSIMGLIIPMLEELFKPIAMWGLVGRNITPAQGFSAGLISGFAFALTESLGFALTPLGDAWSSTMVGRFGTGILHITCSGLVGWGLAVAWSRRQYFKLALAYLLAVSLHCVWNVFSLLMGLGPEVLVGSAADELSLVARLSSIAPFALAVLAAGMLAILFVSNRTLRKEQPQTAPVAVAVFPAEN